MQITEEQRNTEKQMKVILDRLRGEYQGTVLPPGTARTGHSAARATLSRQCQRQLIVFVPLHRALRAYIQPSHNNETRRAAARIYAKHCTKLLRQLRDQCLYRSMDLGFPDFADIPLYVINDIGNLAPGLSVSATLEDEAANLEAETRAADKRRGELQAARLETQRKEVATRLELLQSLTDAQREILKKLGPDGHIILKATNPS